MRAMSGTLLAGSLTLLVGSLTLAAVGCAAVVSPAQAATMPLEQELHGEFRLAAVSCAGDKPVGSFVSVTLGSHAVRNPQSTCAGGLITMLPPGRRALSTEQFTPARALGFGPGGAPEAGGITAAVPFEGHPLGLVTAAQDLQDAPGGGPVFHLPQVHLAGGRLTADLRSVQALYDGPARTTCRRAAGRGCWLIGAQHATGSYDPRSHAFALAWYSGSSFAHTSAATVVHLVGTFRGETTDLTPGRSAEPVSAVSLGAGAALLRRRRSR